MDAVVKNFPKTTAAPEKVASLNPADSPADLTKSVQSELRRVGCLTGEANGDWNVTSQRSLSAFNRNAGTRLDVKTVNADTLDAIKQKSSRVCPLVCDHGFQASGDSCTKIVCKDGYQVGDDNTCEKIPAKRSTPTASRQQQQQSQYQPAPTRQSRAGGVAGAAAGAGGAQIICNDHGCMPKPKGCIVVAVPTGQGCQY